MMRARDRLDWIEDSQQILSEEQIKLAQEKIDL